MSQTNPLSTIVAEVSWVEELKRLLAKAAELSTTHGIGTDEFMGAAWNAMLESNPGLRDELIDKELRVQLKKLRRQGLIGLA